MGILCAGAGEDARRGAYSNNLRLNGIRMRVNPMEWNSVE
jgi:hypothetical protein